MIDDDVRRCLEECDIAGVRRLWHLVAPGIPQPETDYLALATIHRARTQANSIRMQLRAWSHRWLLDQQLPSALPDHLRPRAERMYPQVVGGVGISVNVRSKTMQPVALAIRQAMSDAVMEAYAHRQTEPNFVKARMREAREKTLKS